MPKPRVAILGGGMAGLVTAWELSNGPWRDRIESITVYQRGWRLGGKGASSRGRNGRIEEHGLHVLLGYYDATFRVLRACYQELDREHSDPGCPIRTWRDAFTPTGAVGLADVREGRWDAFVTRFSSNDLLPGEPGAEDRELNPVEVAVRGVRLLGDFLASLGEGEPAGSVYLSAEPTPRPTSPASAAGLRGLAAAGLAMGLEAVVRAGEAAGALTSGVLAGVLDDVIQAVKAPLEDVVAGDRDFHRTWLLVDLVVANLRGMVADGLLAGPERYATIDHLDYREWLAKHGAADETLDSAIVRGMYDLAFAYIDGDPQRPSFSAGLGLQLAGRMLFDFKGSIFWRMEAGMGETVMAPLYQVLRRRGVDVELFHRLDRLRLSDDGRSVGAIELGRQARVVEGQDGYDPLIRVGGLPCWPAAPLQDQLEGAIGPDLESHWGEAADCEKVELVAGRDFDVAVLAVSLGMLPHVCGDLVAKDPRWRRMVDGLRTVATQSFQLWLRVDESALGWHGERGVTLSGFVDPFDTWASMSHLAVREQWPEKDHPETIAYFCSALPERDAGPGRDAGAAVRDNATGFLDEHAAALWPNAVDDSGRFRWDLLCGGEAAGRGPAAFDSQYWRANTDPSDRYVQSVPGSGAHRIKPGESGFDNLVLAGDWTDCGLNAGCVEAATRSGVQAAAAVGVIAVQKAGS